MQRKNPDLIYDPTLKRVEIKCPFPNCMSSEAISYLDANEESTKIIV